MSIFQRIAHFVTHILGKAKEDLAKATVYLVQNIQPILVSGAADIAAQILDVITKTKLPDTVLAELRKWVPVYLTAEGIITTLNADSTQEEVEAELNKLLSLFPNLTAAQRGKLWTSLAAQIYILVHQLDSGEVLTFGEAAAIVEEAYQAYIATKNAD